MMRQRDCDSKVELFQIQTEKESKQLEGMISA